MSFQLRLCQLETNNDWLNDWLIVEIDEFYVLYELAKGMCVCLCVCVW